MFQNTKLVELKAWLCF